jgi:hypothetical protein
MNWELAAARDSRITAPKGKPNAKLTVSHHPISRLKLKDNLRIQTLYAIAFLLDDR